MTAAPPISARLRETLDLLASMGIAPTVEEVVWLAELRRQADTPPGREPPAPCGTPFVFGGAKFFPLHLLAEHWFAQWFRVFEDDATMQAGVYLVAHVYSAPGDKTLEGVASLQEVADLVDSWLSKQAFRKDDIAVIMAAMYALDNDEPETVEAPNKRPDSQPEYKSLEEKVGLLCKTFPGTTAEYWKTGVSKIEATRMASAVSSSESSGAWATSEQRARLIANYLSAVKCIAFKGGHADG
jgi:hypothetical protein